MLKKCIGSLGIVAASCYLKGKNSTNELELNKSLSFSNMCSTKNFDMSLGMHRCFAESNISRNALHEKNLNLQNVGYSIADDDGFDENGFDKWLVHEGAKFDFNYDWRPASSSNTKKLLVFVAAPHANNCGKLSALGLAQNECAGDRMYEILQTRHPQFKRAFLYKSESPLTAEMILKKCDVFRKCGTTDIVNDANPGKFDPKKCSDFNTDQCGFSTDRQHLEDSFRRMIAGSTSAIQVYLTHPNLVRYMLMKSLQFPMNGWKRFQVPPGSITLVEVLRQGSVVVTQVGAHFFHKTKNNEWLRNQYED